VQDDQASDDLAEDWSQLGFRLPVMAMSPYSRKGYVHHDGPYDHTSILKLISWRWDLEPLSLRHATAKNIGEAFDWSQAPRTGIKLAQMETPTAFFSSGCDTAPAAPDDFQRFAESAFLRDHGITPSSPPWPAVFGHGEQAASPSLLGI
jgi:phospholipase C